MKTNPYLFSMTLVGALLFVLGGFPVLWGLNGLSRGLVDLAWIIPTGSSVGSLGVILLVIAWTIAAARWRP